MTSDQIITRINIDIHEYLEYI